jgi:hypothetical protein
MKQLLEFTNGVVEKYPNLKEDVDALIQLCYDEIEEGGPEAHEMEMCWSDVSELVATHESLILSRNI